MEQSSEASFCLNIYDFRFAVWADHMAISKIIRWIFFFFKNTLKNVGNNTERIVYWRNLYRSINIVSGPGWKKDVAEIIVMR